MSNAALVPQSVSAARDHVSPFIWGVALFAVLPNLVFWALERQFDLERSVFNLDYLFVGLLFAVGWTGFGGFLLALFFIVDLLVLVGQVYPFLRVHDVLYLAGLFSEASDAFQFLGSLALLVLLGLVLTALMRGRRVKPLPALALLNLGLLFYGFHVYAEADVAEGMWRQRPGVIVDSQSINFLESRMGGFVESFSVSGEPFVNTGYHGRTADWEKALVTDLNPKLLLIVAESWGAFLSDDIQQAIIKPVMERRARFDWVKHGELAFQGATVAAELRELCGLRPNHFNLKGVVAGFESCLPRKLRDGGYRTAAIHGAVGLMYDRLYWYPRVGFQETHFSETDNWDSRCYSFPGVCDREIAKEYIREVFTGDEKKFVYWLTLNSHSIYDQRDLHGTFFECALYGIPAGSEICRMSQLHAQFFHDLAEILDEESMNGVEVLIVGDHMPPLISTKNKEALIKNEMVSWLHLKIRGGVDLAK